MRAHVCVCVCVCVCVWLYPYAYILSFCGRYLLHTAQLAFWPSQYAPFLLPATEESCHPVQQRHATVLYVWYSNIPSHATRYVYTLILAQVLFTSTLTAHSHIHFSCNSHHFPFPLSLQPFSKSPPLIPFPPLPNSDTYPLPTLIPSPTLCSPLLLCALPHCIPCLPYWQVPSPRTAPQTDHHSLLLAALLW